MNKKDRLLEIFHQMLRRPDAGDETAQQLIQRVALAYALEIGEMGIIPDQFRNDVMVDLEAEVLEMYRKKTYGFFSLQEYRESKRGSRKRA
ncbi:MAG: DNA-dependent DNA polymerase [Bdellovibrionaceae bacterium]|nr:DNA-dependent DNA polymerase [Pseudobdellovibrionaceae bacterium]MBX3034485.1 DNA-dependent DNA polymerase [Pseudobdellovibrionaceae bacterium]